MLKLEVAPTASEKTRPPFPVYSAPFPSTAALQWACRKHQIRRQRPAPPSPDSPTPSPHYSRTPSPYHDAKVTPLIQPQTPTEKDDDHERGSRGAAGDQDEEAVWRGKAVIAAHDDGDWIPSTSLAPQNPPGGDAEGRSLRRRAAAVAKPRKVELWVGLSREEIEEDYYSITGAKLPRRPKRRPKPVPANLLDRIFPGAWLPSTIVAEIYKVHEPRESRKM